MGVPVIGCDCRVCTSSDPRNQRTRPSVLIELPQGNLLIDTAPEMRLQLIREQVHKIHVIAFTHFHADHLFGLDDARMFPKYVEGSVPVYCEAATESVIRKVFSYAFVPQPSWYPGGGVPKLHFVRIGPGTPFRVLDEEVLPIRLKHGRLDVLGFRIGGLAYCTDVSLIPEASWSLLEGLDTLVLDALRYEPHPTHFNIEQALEVVDRLRPRRTFFTHISHAIDHAELDARLPEGVRLAYDGLTIMF